MARNLLSCCRALGQTCLGTAPCHQLPQIPALVQPWVATDEAMLKHILSYTLTKCYGARIIADEWEPVQGQSNLGKGDVVAQLPCGAHLAIELKYIDTRTPGATARARRKQHRAQVAVQASRYGQLWHERLQQEGDTRPVICASFTNEKGLVYHESAADVDAATADDAPALAGFDQCSSSSTQVHKEALNTSKSDWVAYAP